MKEAMISLAINDGVRPVIPSYVPEPITKLISSSWHGDPFCRPTSEELFRRLSSIIYNSQPELLPALTGKRFTGVGAFKPQSRSPTTSSDI